MITEPKRKSKGTNKVRDLLDTQPTDSKNSGRAVGTALKTRTNPKLARERVRCGR